MKRVVITQRLDHFEHINETREALDTKLTQLVWQMNMIPIPVCSGVSDHEAYFDALRPDAVILSGGPDISAYPQRDRLEKSLLAYSVAQKLPVFGICRGLQMINHYQGGGLVAIDDHIATRHVVRGPIFPDPVEVNSFHGYAITRSTLGQDLEACGFSDDSSIEAIRHITLPWMGIMWHPERESQISAFDIELMLNHLDQ